LREIMPMQEELAIICGGCSCPKCGGVEEVIYVWVDAKTGRIECKRCRSLIKKLKRVL